MSKANDLLELVKATYICPRGHKIPEDEVEKKGGEIYCPKCKTWIYERQWRISR